MESPISFFRLFRRLLQKPDKSLLKALILLRRSGFGAAHSAAGTAYLSVLMTAGQKPRNILVAVEASILIDRPCAQRQTQRRQRIILRYHNIARPESFQQRKIRAVRALFHHDGLHAVQVKHMRAIAYQRHRRCARFCQTHRQARYRAGVRININVQAAIPSLLAQGRLARPVIR